jgi:signal recognition particle GTPase
LAKYLKDKGFKVAVSSTDVRRPAAMLQLQRLAEKIEVPYYHFGEGLSALEIAKKAQTKAKEDGVDYLLFGHSGKATYRRGANGRAQWHKVCGVSLGGALCGGRHARARSP